MSIFPSISNNTCGIVLNCLWSIYIIVRYTISYRKFRDINIACFIDDLRNSELITNRPDDLRELCELYDSTKTDIVDKYSPFITKTMFDTHNVPWYTKDIQAAKRHRRYCERLWGRTRLTVHHDMFL